jgi:shikimate 5-dehydrogenase
MAAHQYVFGFLGPRCTGNIRALWNARLREQGIDGFFDFYRTTTRRDLETRLSEMFLLERRGYLVDPSLQEACVALMDTLTSAARSAGLVDTVRNERGVLTGDFLGHVDPEARLTFWMTSQVSD